jgi:hypothetical protein
LIQWIDHGTYLIPVSWNNRLIIFFPLFTKKTVPSGGTTAGKTFQGLSNDQVDDHKPIESWEIKMGWSEYRNGKWTQKQQSADAVYQSPAPLYLQMYEFVPRVLTFGDGAPAIVIDCYRNQDFFQSGDSQPLGSFRFEGSQIRTSDPFVTTDPTNAFTDFHYVFEETYNKFTKIYSLQAVNQDALSLFGQQPLFHIYDSSATVQYDQLGAPEAGSIEFDFYHPFVHNLLGKMGNGSLDDLFDCYRTYFNAQTDVNKKDDVYGGYIQKDGTTTSFDELKRPYALYNMRCTIGRRPFMRRCC